VYNKCISKTVTGLTFISSFMHYLHNVCKMMQNEGVCSSVCLTTWHVSSPKLLNGFVLNLVPQTDN
jgi:hypothetical protein